MSRRRSIVVIPENGEASQAGGYRPMSGANQSIWRASRETKSPPSNSTSGLATSSASHACRNRSGSVVIPHGNPMQMRR